METTSSTSEQRIRASARPDGWTVNIQTWKNIFFLHWAVDIERLEPHLPQGLTIDTFDGKAWITITPLQIYNVRLPYLPPIPYFSELNELNLRTYVSMESMPGVYFFSLDANNLPAVIGANTFFSLPYFYSDIRVEVSREAEVTFESSRYNDKQLLKAQWHNNNNFNSAPINSAEHFLVERYCLYTESSGRLYRARIHHKPWQLSAVSQLELSTNLLEPFGIPKPATLHDIAHAGDEVTVEVWPLERIGR